MLLCYIPMKKHLLKCMIAPETLKIFMIFSPLFVFEKMCKERLGDPVLLELNYMLQPR